MKIPILSSYKVQGKDSQALPLATRPSKKVDSLSLNPLYLKLDPQVGFAPINPTYPTHLSMIDIISGFFLITVTVISSIMGDSVCVPTA